MKISTLKFRQIQCSCLVVLYFAIVTAGFDVYWHTTSYRLDGFTINHSYNLFGFPVPRYFLLSYIYGVGGWFGVPLMWIAILLVSIPVFAILRYIQKQREIKLTDYVILQAFFFLTVFYSGLSLALMYVIAFTITKKKFLLFGILSHPIGILLYFLSFVVHRAGLLRMVSIITLFLIISRFVWFSDVSFKYDVNINNISKFYYLLTIKKQEITFLGILLVIVFFILRPLQKLKLTQAWNGFVCTNFLVIIFLIFVTKDSVNMIKNPSHPVVYLAWFELGRKSTNAVEGLSIAYYDSLRR